MNAVCLELKSNANELDNCMTRGKILFCLLQGVYIFLGLNIIKLHSHLCNSNCCLVMQRVATPLVSADLLYTKLQMVWYCWGTKQQSTALPLDF